MGAILLPGSSATVLEGHVLGRAHLDQSRGGALEGAGQALAGVQPRGRRIRAAHQVDVAVVELVDQGDEAARGVVAARVHHRDPAQQHGVELARDLDVVDRKSTRLNSSHVKISYAVFCLKKKKKYET